MNVLLFLVDYGIIFAAKRPLRDTTTADGTSPAKGVVMMVTYENLFAFCMVSISIISLVLAFTGKDK